MESERAKQEKQMVYRYLGNTGLKVSVLSFGNWITGHDEKEEEVQFQCMKRAWEAGVNFFDTAEGYGHGVAEEIFGKAIKRLGAAREDLVVSTKIYFYGPEANQRGNSRKHIIEGTKNSLKRLQMDYVDLLFSHRPDYFTPLEEVCRAFSFCVD